MWAVLLPSCCRGDTTAGGAAAAPAPLRELRGGAAPPLGHRRNAARDQVARADFLEDEQVRRRTCCFVQFPACCAFSIDASSRRRSAVLLVLGTLVDNGDGPSLLFRGRCAGRFVSRSSSAAAPANDLGDDFLVCLHTAVSVSIRHAAGY
jgi:hypothetical protein